MNTFIGRKNLNDYMKISLKYLRLTMNEMKKKIENGEEVDLSTTMIFNAMETSFGRKIAFS